MPVILENPFTKWKNLTADPCVVIKRDILRFGEIFYSLKDTIGKLKGGNSKINSSVSKIAKLELEIEDYGKKLKKARSKKEQDKINKKLEYLKKSNEKLLKSGKGIESDFVKNASSSYVQFVELINIIYRLNIQCLTLIHRARKDIDSLIQRVKLLKHSDNIGLEKLKLDSISELNAAKSALKSLCDELYRSSEYQSRSIFNPQEVIKEFSPQSTPVKIKRIKRLAIEIAAIEDYISTVSKNLLIVNLHHLVSNQIKQQVHDFDALSHHIKVLTHRFHGLLYNYPGNKKLKKPLKKILSKIEKQTRLLWNSIHIEHYSPKIRAEASILNFRKKPEPEKTEYKKAA